MTAISTAPRPFCPWRGGRKNPGAAVAAPGLEGQQQNQNVAVSATAQVATLRQPSIQPGKCKRAQCAESSNSS
ncbi:hypothetical protein [Methyloversatilis discipulorum]|uniref:hypothetical protein n=1 Tax=Methyloversatilis discipulorum TaxID=1119528 RepID=UPI003137B472